MTEKNDTVAKITDHKKQQKLKKKVAMDEYDEHLDKVYVLKKMTDTRGWRRFYDGMIAERKRHEQMILTEEKTRAMVAHQEAIKFINGMLVQLQQPINKLNNYCVGMPLFATEFHTRAQWNSAIGSVELSESR